jgi:PAS domain S-box-containing protein
MTSNIPAKLCDHIVQNAPEAIIYADRAGIIQLWNTGAEAMFGYAAEEALGSDYSRASTPTTLGWL